MLHLLPLLVDFVTAPQQVVIQLSFPMVGPNTHITAKGNEVVVDQKPNGGPLGTYGNGGSGGGAGSGGGSSPSYYGDVVTQPVTLLSCTSGSAFGFRWWEEMVTTVLLLPTCWIWWRRCW